MKLKHENGCQIIRFTDAQHRRRHVSKNERKLHDFCTD